MGKAKVKGVMTIHTPRYHKEREIIPCKYFAGKSGAGVMVAQYKDTRDLVVDENGNPVHWNKA